MADRYDRGRSGSISNNDNFTKIDVPAHPTNTQYTFAKTRVTQSDVARVAKVHVTTVSIALRNGPAIPETTRQRIRAIADKLGYYPDPALQALVAYRKRYSTIRRKRTLAYLTNGETRWGWRTRPDHERAYLGAQQKAAELACQLEHFWLGEPGISHSRLSSILYHRGISGVLIAAHEVQRQPLAGLDWSQLCAVQIGGLPCTPALHRVTDDYGNMVRCATRRGLLAGYQRIGLVMAQWWDDSANNLPSACFLAEQNQLAKSQRIPILRFGGSRSDWTRRRTTQNLLSERSALVHWYRAYHPDVIIGFSPAVLELIEQLGWSVPRDLAYVELDREHADRRVAGFARNCDKTGEAAVTMLIRQILLNARGWPSVPMVTMLSGTWSEGASLPTAPASPGTELCPTTPTRRIEVSGVTA